MAEQEYIEMKIPAKPEYIGVVRLTLSGIASRMGFDYDIMDDLKIAISEAITNGIMHGYKGKMDGEILIRFGILSNRLEVIIAHTGEQFDFDKAKMNIGPHHERKQSNKLSEGGLGLYLIDSLMDEVKFIQNNGVTVVMTKYLEGEQVDHVENIVSTK